jgi:hypothetical protein
VIDDKPDANAGNPGPGGDPPKLSDPMDVRADRAAGINDQRHRFVLSGVWDLNYVSHLPKSTKAISGSARSWRSSVIGVCRKRKKWGC